jgi:uncharacterized membrane protein YdfJ with MMPL/SSD domain
MAVAFSGLLFSTETILNQTAFLLCVSVLLDTFVQRWADKRLEEEHRG